MYAVKQSEIHIKNKFQDNFLKRNKASFYMTMTYVPCKKNSFCLMILLFKDIMDILGTQSRIPKAILGK